MVVGLRREAFVASHSDDGTPPPPGLLSGTFNAKAGGGGVQY